MVGPGRLPQRRADHSPGLNCYCLGPREGCPREGSQPILTWGEGSKVADWGGRDSAPPPASASFSASV